METVEETLKNTEKMNFLDYYNRMSDRRPSPKADFIKKVADRCQISEATVRWWTRGIFKPSRPEFYRILSEMTGIPQEDLFE